MKISSLKSRGLVAVGLMLTVALASLACSDEEVPTATPVPLPPIVVEIGMTASTVMAPVNIDFEAENFTDGAVILSGISVMATRRRERLLDTRIWMPGLSQ